MQPVLNCGGNWNNGDNAGLWSWNGNNSSSNANGNIGGRILIENYYVAHTILAPWQKNTSQRGRFRKFLRLIEAILENGGDCLPIGYYTSQWFYNFFLEGFDHFVKEELKIKYYVRYVDDMVLLDTNKRKLRKAIEEIEKHLGNIGLKLKANYQVWKVHSRPIDFVGFRFYKDKTLLRKKIFFRLCRRVRRIRKTGYITVRQAQGILSLLGWLCHINGWKFYKERIYPYAPKWKLKLIVSNHAKKIKFGGTKK